MTNNQELEEERRELRWLESEDVSDIRPRIQSLLDALPLRNAQVQAVLAYCERLEILGNGLAQCGDVKGSAGALASATGIRRAIEEAGA